MHLILSFKPHSRADGARDDYVKQVMTIVMDRKQIYFKPVISVLSFMEENALMAASPGVRPGGGGQGNIKVIELINDVDEENDYLEG